MPKIKGILALLLCVFPPLFATPVTLDEQKPILTVRFSDETVENIGIVTAGRPMTKKYVDIFVLTRFVFKG